MRYVHWCCKSFQNDRNWFSKVFKLRRFLKNDIYPFKGDHLSHCVRRNNLCYFNYMVIILLIILLYILIFQSSNLQMSRVTFPPKVSSGLSEWFNLCDGYPHPFQNRYHDENKLIMRMTFRVQFFFFNLNLLSF